MSSQIANVSAVTYVNSSDTESESEIQVNTNVIDDIPMSSATKSKGKKEANTPKAAKAPKTPKVVKKIEATDDEEENEEHNEEKEPETKAKEPKAKKVKEPKAKKVPVAESETEGETADEEVVAKPVKKAAAPKKEPKSKVVKEPKAEKVKPEKKAKVSKKVKASETTEDENEDTDDAPDPNKSKTLKDCVKAVKALKAKMVVESGGDDDSASEVKTRKVMSAVERLDHIMETLVSSGINTEVTTHLLRLRKQLDGATIKHVQGKRAPNAFNIWIAEQMKVLKDEGSTLTPKEKLSHCTTMWNKKKAAIIAVIDENTV